VGYTYTITDNNSLGGYNSSEYQLGGGIKLPLYSQLANPQGNPLSINKFYPNSFTDTVGGGKLLDWKYRPLQDLANNDMALSTNALPAIWMSGMMLPAL